MVPCVTECHNINGLKRLHSEIDQYLGKQMAKSDPAAV